MPRVERVRYTAATRGSLFGAFSFLRTCFGGCAGGGGLSEGPRSQWKNALVTAVFLCCFCGVLSVCRRCRCCWSRRWLEGLVRTPTVGQRGSTMRWLPTRQMESFLDAARYEKSKFEFSTLICFRPIPRGAKRFLANSDAFGNFFPLALFCFSISTSSPSPPSLVTMLVLALLPPHHFPLLPS